MSAKKRKKARPGEPLAPAPGPVGERGTVAGFRRRLPYLVLAVAMLGVVLMQNGKVGFELGHHGFLSSHGVSLAKNLSIGNGLLLFHAANVADNGAVTYEAYNRFPVFPFLALKGVMAVLEPDLASQVYWSRQVMNLFLCLAMLFAFLALRETLDDPHLALCAVLLSFSSFYIQYYGDMIFNDTPALFGFTLALWLAARSRARAPRTRTLAAAAVVAISMGWQPYAVFLCWTLVDAVNAARGRDGGLRALATRPSVVAFSVAVLWGVLVLGAEFLNEWRVLGGSFREIGSLQAALWRAGGANPDIDVRYAEALRWTAYLWQQGERIAGLFVPASLAPVLLGPEPALPLVGLAAAGLLVLSIVKAVRDRSFAAKGWFLLLLVSGFFWTLPMRKFAAFHDFQTIYYIGLPLGAYGGIALFFRRRNAWPVAVAALLFFLFNVHFMNGEKERVAAMVNPITREFQNVYNLLPEKSRVYVDGDKNRMGLGFHAVDFYLAGRYFATPGIAQYVLTTRRLPGAQPLTSNVYIHLYGKP